MAAQAVPATDARVKLEADQVVSPGKRIKKESAAVAVKASLLDQAPGHCEAPGPLTACAWLGSSGKGRQACDTLLACCSRGALQLCRTRHIATCCLSYVSQFVVTTPALFRFSKTTLTLLRAYMLLTS